MSGAGPVLCRRPSPWLKAVSRSFLSASAFSSRLSPSSAFVSRPRFLASLPSQPRSRCCCDLSSPGSPARRQLGGVPSASPAYAKEHARDLHAWTGRVFWAETSPCSRAAHASILEGRREKDRRSRHSRTTFELRRSFMSCALSDGDEEKTHNEVTFLSERGEFEGERQGDRPPGTPCPQTCPAAPEDGDSSRRLLAWLLLPLGAFLGATAFASPPSLSSPSLSSPSLSSASLSSPSLSFWRRLARAALPLPARCCGIVGYVGDKEAEPVLMEGLEILQNRGYDSCGITSISPEGQLVTTKFASRGTTCDSIEILRREGKHPHRGNHIGIAHTRWATHGSKTDENAHPHHDWKDRISLVHNGTIDNFAVLKKALIDRGCTFRSSTDSEVVANLIGWYLDQPADDPDASAPPAASSPASSSAAARSPAEGETQAKCLSFEEAVKRAVGELQGTWGLCVVHKDHPDRLVLARNGSPLLVGSVGDQLFVASEPAALARHTNQYLMLKDGEIAVVTAQGVGQLEATRPVHRIAKETIELSPEPFAHWTLKEIFEQPQALARAMNYGGRIAPYQNRVKLGGLDQNRESLLTVKSLLLCGCGTSLYAGIYGELLMQWLRCFDQVRAVDASEVDIYHLPRQDAGVLLLSQSGETLDTVRACQLADFQGLKKFSVVNQVGSLLARMTNCGVYVNAGREVAVASTKAFTSQVAVLSLIAAWFAQNQPTQAFPDRCSALMDAIHRLPVYAGMTLNCRALCQNIAERLKDAKTLFVLGKGFGYPVALEGALKIKELAYLHAEGFPAGALKHGPFALIDEKEKTPVILVLLADQHAASLLNAAQQVKARGAHLICVTDEPDIVKDLADDVLVVPSNGPLTALLACIPLQLLAYELAIAKGINPDKPRGLAKTVTVM
uniref:glutamine--fructose-6-phosphate transaminase (isomerizing) n=1 Tax=Toxoplasma gondii COUG TaxID=1074873 RepID=A0A2G8Y7L0_TOXGO|nr:glucosamine-fructose-6-phosphate aminotransferase [Toxoplasma gondii COUG]